MDAQTAPPSLPEEQADPRLAARAAKLRYVHDRQPGFRRERLGEKEFRIVDPAGCEVTDPEHLERIRKLAIPPAYEQVWICRYANGHLQATGRDARGRKQYRYHPKWRLVRDETKYQRMLVFGRLLPRIREQVKHDLSLPGLPRERVLAAIVRLLEGTLVRVGNEEYARENRSFGLTTLRNRHVKVDGGHVAFDFRGKHGIRHHIDLSDRRLAAIVRRCRDLPEQHLFSYLDEAGEARAIGSDDVNDYLQAISGEEITAKDFRTWAGTNLAALALSGLEAFDTKARAKHNIVQAVESVAKKLGNTPAICRKCYIHPAIFEGYLDGTLAEGLRAHADAMLHDTASGLSAEEVAVTAYLERRLREASGGPA